MSNLVCKGIGIPVLDSLGWEDIRYDSNRCCYDRHTARGRFQYDTGTSLIECCHQKESRFIHIWGKLSTRLHESGRMQLQSTPFRLVANPGQERPVTHSHPYQACAFQYIEKQPDALVP